MRPLLRLVRLPNTLSAAADVLAGAALAGAAASSSTVLVAALGSAAVYGGGVALNDLADRDRDRLHHPDRPIPSGRVSPRRAAWVAVALLVAGAASGLPAGGLHAAVTAALVAAVVGYDFLGQRAPLAGCFLMGTCRALNLLRGVTLLPGLGAEDLAAPAAYGLLVVLLTLASRLEDRPFRPGELLLPAFGLLPLHLVPALLAAITHGVTDPVTPACAAGGLLLWGYVARPAIGTPKHPGLLVFRGVFTLVLVDAFYALSARELLLALVLAAFLPAMRLLARLIGQPGS